MPPVKASKRRHASMACLACRESKIKCDGGDPTCSSCANRNRDCRYQAVDKRKVDQLCHFIRDNGLQPPPMAEEKDSALTKTLEILGLAEVNSTLTQQVTGKTMGPSVAINGADSHFQGSSPIPINPTATNQSENAEPQPTGPSPEPGSVEAVPSKPLHSFSRAHNEAITAPLPEHRDEDNSPGNILGAWDWDIGLGTTPNSSDMQHFFGSASPGGTLVTPFEDIPEAFSPVLSDNNTLVEESSDAEDIEGLIDELSDRVGTLRIGPGGQTQFCGPTSNFNLADMPVSETLEAHRKVQNDVLRCLDCLGTSAETFASLEDHLINLYFSWQDPFFHVVDRKIYEEAKTKWLDKGGTPFYSEALRNAMCALGAAFEPRYHPTFVTFPKSLVDFFGDRAKSLLEIELDCPCVATIQAMVILSSHEIGNGKDARGWLYSGMATRLAFDLALHLDMSAYVSSGAIAAADADLRRTVFWAAYTVDHLLGFYLGRPCRTNMEDVTVGKPNNQANHWGTEKWVPYVSPNSVEPDTGLLDCMEAVNQQQVTLCELMTPCGYILYGTSHISKAVLQELNAKIVAKLLIWKANLPPTLQINLNDHTSLYLPHVLLLHMQYYQNIIYAHRPWMSKGHLQPQPPKGPGYLHAREMCIQSAIAIAKILVLYETRYTLRRINVKAVSITSSAILFLLFAAVCKYPRHGDNDIAIYLSTCFRALDEFAQSWQSARRAKDILVRLRQQWETRTRSSSKFSRSNGGIMYTPRKRSRTSNRVDAAFSGIDQERIPSARHDSHTDLELDGDLDWTFMADGQLLPENCDGDLYWLIPNSGIVEPGHGNL
ncbi:hypothetical protein N7510_008528 [Penicillium lagena]|uniref:uncharacterized protein n=1 Tax=Penicillium lagena TaxID=94218 RepID=UPI0025404CF9|nr:uncharacterized protein N7510_008528 [Penicillium lagena]KAJ5605747.1 hypothetical protein N7510_008528 [Penicillium lagena]